MFSGVVGEFGRGAVMGDDREIGGFLSFADHGATLAFNSIARGTASDPISRATPSRCPEFPPAGRALVASFPPHVDFLPKVRPCPYWT